MSRRAKIGNSRRPSWASALLRRILNYAGDRKGAVSPILILALVPIIGTMGMALEASNWWLMQRSLQNAADTAAMAANWNGGTTAAGSGSVTSYSTAGCSTNPGYFDCEAVGAAAQAGFTNGSNNVVVYPQYRATCPIGSGACWQVTVTKQVPLYLLG